MSIIETRNSIAKTTVTDLGTVHVPDWLPKVNARVEALIASNDTSDADIRDPILVKRVRAIENTLEAVHEAFIKQHALDYAIGSMNLEDYEKILDYFKVVIDKCYDFTFNIYEFVHGKK